MSVLTLIVILVAIGVAAWAVNAYIPMSPGVKKVLNVALIIIAILICLSAFGILGDIRGTDVPKL
jgi:hypothetical protein